MSASAAEELPEEFPPFGNPVVAEEHDRKGPERAATLGERRLREAEPDGTGWLLVGLLLTVGVGVLMLILFASGGNADESMML